MNLYKIVIKPVTSFCSPLQSDTFFGAFCWSYLHKYGEEALQEMICHSKTGRPDIIFSNAFPEGRLPMPAGIYNFRKSENGILSKQERYEQYIIHKKESRLATITLKEFNSIINGTETPYSDGSNSELTTVSWRNMVSREAGSVESIEGAGSLFEAEETFTKENYDIYICSSLERNVLDSTLDGMFKAGIGAQRSIGKGAFDIVGALEKFDGFEIPPKPNGFVALSNFIPQRGDPTEGYYRTLIKYPKLSYVSAEEDSPFKKPFIFLKAGSVFCTHPVKEFYGSCIERVALKGGIVSDEIVIGAYTVAIPCYLSY